MSGAPAGNEYVMNKTGILKNIRRLAGALSVVLLLLAATSRVQAETRLALVIGNGSYKNYSHLANPTNDAQLVATTLQSLGFTLIGDGAQTDVDKLNFERLIRRFGRELAGGGVGLFYYAGHGLQLQGTNYLVPVDADVNNVADADYELIDAGLVLKQMDAAGSKLNMMILDACRNNPFGGRGLRDAGSGLAVMRAPRGTIISYATQPGNVARDGTDGHSPYTKALAEALQKPGNRVLEVFNDVGLTVDKATKGEQQPWVASSPIEGDFYFASATPTANVVAAAPEKTAPSPPSAAPASSLPGDAELLFWQSVMNSGAPADYEAYLKQYPQGRFIDLAHNRLALMSRGPPPMPPLPPPPPVPAAMARPPHPEVPREQCAGAKGQPGIRQYCASSVLPARVGDRSGRSNYEVANLFDGNPATAWVKAREQPGNGWILIDFDGDRLIIGIVVANGYQKNDTAFRTNFRIRRLRLLASTGETAIATLADQLGTQRVALDHPIRGEWVQIFIDDLFPGMPDADVAISELSVIAHPP
jgi:uncharacterized caspase-like protein